MDILVVGGGGREHAIVHALSKSTNVDKIWCTPGNGGISYLANTYPINACDLEEVVNFAIEKKIDFAIVAQDDPLSLGMVDRLEEAGIKTFGPNRLAARIESSKAFAKELMKKYNIPTANYNIFNNFEDARDFIENVENYPIVVKADGLALGKGVIICENVEQAYIALKEIMVDKKFGDSGNRIVIEEFLEGIEVSVLSFCDGKTCIPLVSSMDHKRALDNDEGLNTGGMGVIAPNPYYTQDIANYCMENIYIPTLRAMEKEGCPFKGCLYFGLMLTKSGPKVIEYNCRFGDPEAQAVLPLLESDFLKICQKCVDGNLIEKDVKFSNLSSACVVLASGGYPDRYEKNKLITGLENGQLYKEDNSIYVYSAGVKRDGDNNLYTSGGRVLSVVALGNTLEEAIDKAYENIEKIKFENSFYRHDIGKKALSINK